MLSKLLRFSTYDFYDDLNFVSEILADERSPTATTVQEVLDSVAMLEQVGYWVAFTLKNEWYLIDWISKHEIINFWLNLVS